MLIIDTMLMACVSMCIDLWSHALSISYYKMNRSCIEKESVNLFCEMRKLLSKVEEVLPQHRYQLHISNIDTIRSFQGLPSLAVWQLEASENFHVQAR